MESLTRLHKALSEEIRLRMVMLLMESELCVCDLMNIFGQPQSKISRHLAYLKNSGVVGNRRVGVWMHYFLKNPLTDLWSGYLDFMKEKLYHLDQFKKDREALTELKKRNGCRALGSNRSSNHSQEKQIHGKDKDFRKKYKKEIVR